MDKKVGHFRRYTIKNIENLLTSAGFVIKQSAYVDSMGFLATLLFKIIGNKKGDVNKEFLEIYDKYMFPVSIFLDIFFKRFFGKNLYVFAIKA